jgi:hypothetical protein
MTTTTDRRRLNRGVARAASLCLLALASVLLQGREARAQWTTSGTTTTTTGSVGVGTAAPATSLHVSTAATGTRGIISEQTSADSNSALLFFRKSRAGAAAQNGDNVGSLFGSAFDGASFINSARLRFSIDGPVSAGSVPTNIQFLTGSNADGVERMRITSAGNVGVGTAAPLAPIHVATGTSTGGVAFFQKDAASNGVGIGTTNGAGTISGVNSSYTLSTDLLINPFAGNVGVGTSTPTAKLDVNGDIRVSGNINAKYQDVAEWVPSTQKLQAGTVVVLDTRHANHVSASTTSYDTRVAGVVSAQPGISLGEAGEGKALVATTGRVKVKVDATRAPIQIGDLIVTSDVEGVAMKSEPISLGGRQFHAPGTIIGKALESLDKGTGEILVLLSLQ